MGLFDRWKKQKTDPIYQRLSKGHAAYIKNLVERAGAADRERDVFGAQKHQYRLNPVITLEEVKAFEEKYQVSFPEEYVFFLTNVGNGGAGPYYGIYPLEKLATYNEHIHVSGKPAWIDETRTAGEWAEKMNLLEEADDETYDQMMNEIGCGFTVIGTQGCTYDNLLMNSGSAKGQMVYIDWNLAAENAPYLTGMSFLEWYEQFFLEIISGNTVNSYGCIRLGTEAELIAAYQNASAKEQRSILISFHRFTKVTDAAKQFLFHLENRELDAIRIELLFKLDLDHGIELFERLLNGEHPQAAVTCARRLPKEYLDRYYIKMLDLLCHFEMPYEKDGYCSRKQRLLYFLSDCDSLSAKDLIPFVTDPGCHEEELKTAIYVMGKAGDKMSCMEYFIKFMKADSYWIAHTALQAVARSSAKELIETYEWMWNKYKNDKVMCSNLIIAFQTNGIKKEAK